ncbi:hypothetical protein B8A36_02115 [Escherichia coli]|uniref:cell division protein DrpB n=2 Tax=Escherichia coli TaxID=562 RepID=UPI000A1FCA55|nr:cell division protein DrpB [Escherichia coli]OSQ40049.1 hypothetical protein B8A36_02115 [Escherichia coli]
MGTLNHIRRNTTTLKLALMPDAPVSGFESDLGSTAGKWLGALVGFLFMALVGALLGSIAWYTRPRPARSRRYE